MLPPVSLPIEKPTSPAAVAAPGPALDARRALLEQPRVHRLPAEPDVVERERAEAELRDQHRARLVQPARRRRRPSSARGCGTARRRRSSAMPAVSSRSLAPQGMPCSGPRYLPAAISASARRACGEREVAGERDDAPELRVEALEPLEVDAREPLGRQLARLDPARQRRRRARTRCPRRAPAAAPRRRCDAHEAVARGPTVDARGGAGFHCVAGASVRSSATLRGPVRRSYSGAIDCRQLPAACARSAGVIVHLHQLLRLGEGRGRDLGPDGGAVPNAGGAGRRRRAPRSSWARPCRRACRPPRVRRPRRRPAPAPCARGIAAAMCSCS